ncbi:MAG: lipopolysaccharide biosynthesis protein [Flavobacteriaceae bacterium]
MDKNLVFIISGRIVQILITLASIRLLTSLLNPEEVGNYYLAISILAFFNLVFLNAPGMYFSRYLLEWQRSKNLFNAIFVFILWILIVVLISVLSVNVLFEISNYDEKFDNQTFILFIILSILISTIHRNLIYGANTIGFTREFVIFSITTSLIGLASSVGFVYLFEASSLYWLFGIIISECSVLYFAFKFFIKGNLLDIKKIKATITKERLQKIFFFSLPIAVTTFLMWGQNMSYRFIIDYKYSAEALGYIAIGLGVASSIFGSLEALITQYFNPIFLKDLLDSTKKGRAKAWNKMASIVIPIYFFALVFVITMSEKLIIVLADNQFHESYHYTLIGAFIEFFRVTTNLLNGISQAELKTNKTILPYLIGFSVVVISLLIFDFSHNLTMIPLVLALGYFFVCFFMYIKMNKLLQIKTTINLFKTFIYSTPFGIVFILPSNDNIFYNLSCLAIFGIYFLIVSKSIIPMVP